MQANYHTIAVKNVNQVKGNEKKHRQTVGSVDYFFKHTSYSPARPRLSDEKGANIIFGSNKEIPNAFFLFSHTDWQPVSHFGTDFKSAQPNLFVCPLDFIPPLKGVRGCMTTRFPPSWENDSRGDVRSPKPRRGDIIIGVRNQESGIRNQESGIRNQESGIRM